MVTSRDEELLVPVVVMKIQQVALLVEHALLLTRFSRFCPVRSDSL